MDHSFIQSKHIIFFSAEIVFHAFHIFGEFSVFSSHSQHLEERGFVMLY